MKSWFSNEASGLKADIKRHSDMEKQLKEYIKAEKESPDEGSEVFLKVYNALLDNLMQSKAEVVSKIGKKND